MGQGAEAADAEAGVPGFDLLGLGHGDRRGGHEEIHPKDGGGDSGETAKQVTSGAEVAEEEDAPFILASIGEKVTAFFLIAVFLQKLIEGGFDGFVFLFDLRGGFKHRGFDPMIRVVAKRVLRP